LSVQQVRFGSFSQKLACSAQELRVGRAFSFADRNYHIPMFFPQDLLTSSFLGPMVPAANKGARQRHIYLSLQHWYEAAKFMPFKPELRDAVLFCPSIKEAKKFSRMHQKDWRSDWNMVRPSVLISGLAFLTIHRPELGLANADIETLKTGLSQMNLPERFVDACLERYDVWRKGPAVSFFGAELAPSLLVGQRLSKLVTPLPSWTMVTPCNGRTAWRLHDWCLTHFVPVQYIGKPTDRMGRQLIELIIKRSDQIVVFEARRSKKNDATLQVAKLHKKKISLELFDPATPEQSLPGIG